MDGVLPPHRFVELPFVAVNPDAETTLAWPVTQIYEGGEVVEWAGPEDSDAPASITLVVAAEGTGWPTSSWLAVAGFAIALLALGVAIRPRHAG